MTMQPNRAIVIEDDRSWNQILSEILSDHGFEVDSAYNLQEAIDHLKNNTHRLAVVDLSLSPKDHNNTDGLRVLQAVRLMDPNCRSILLTGFATVELAVSALTNYHAFTFLRKESFSRGQFRDIINKILLTAPADLSQSIYPESNHARFYSDREGDKKNNYKGAALVVEDDAGWRGIIEELLADLDYQVISCASFGDALGYIRREKFNLAVVDMSLTGSIQNFWNPNTPQKNLEGYQLLAATHAGKITTIVVSGVASPDEIMKVYSQKSVFAYLEKQSFDRNKFSKLVLESQIQKLDLSETSSLTDREKDVFDLVAQGLTNKEIAEKLAITTNTVKRHIKAIFEKLNVHTRSAAASKAVSEKG